MPRRCQRGGYCPQAVALDMPCGESLAWWRGGESSRHRENELGKERLSSRCQTSIESWSHAVVVALGRRGPAERRWGPSATSARTVQYQPRQDGDSKSTAL
jgi:hypothetical protein